VSRVHALFTLTARRSNRGVMPRSVSSDTDDAMYLLFDISIVVLGAVILWYRERLSLHGTVAAGPSPHVALALSRQARGLVYLREGMAWSLHSGPCDCLYPLRLCLALEGRLLGGPNQMYVSE
jgi:hypothetical protein